MEYRSMSLAVTKISQGDGINNDNGDKDDSWHLMSTHYGKAALYVLYRCFRIILRAVLSRKRFYSHRWAGQAQELENLEKLVDK